MIPKILHYCWFGGKEKPKEFLQYLETWRTRLPDFELKEWNETNFDYSSFRYAREAYLTRNYAHVSDVCRIYALYTYGGIYLDTDVEVVSSFAPYMRLPSFVSMESTLVGAAVIGAAPGQPWIKRFLDFYSTTHFINSCGHAVRTPNTKLLTCKILPSLEIKDWPTIFPADYFCGIRGEDGLMHATENTIAIHHFAASWRRKKTFSQRVKLLREGLKVRYCRSSHNDG